MSLTTDNVRPSPMPNAWRIGSLTVAGVTMGVCLLAFCTGVLAVGKFGMGLDTEALRSLAFVVLVFGSQATIYAIRERRHLWGSRPSLLLAVSSVADVAIASALAVGGIAMTPLPALLVAGMLGVAAVFAVVLDLVKVPVFAHLGIAQSPRRGTEAYVAPGKPKGTGTPARPPGAAQPRTSDSKPAAKFDAKLKPEAEAEVKPASTPEAKVQPNPETKAEIKPENQAAES
jgi:hypothetical protein